MVYTDLGLSPEPQQFAVLRTAVWAKLLISRGKMHPGAPADLLKPLWLQSSCGPKKEPLPQTQTRPINTKFNGSGPVRGTRGARIRTRLATQCRLHQKSTPQTNSSPISHLSGKFKFVGVGVPWRLFMCRASIPSPRLEFRALLCSITEPLPPAPSVRREGPSFDQLPPYG